MKIEDQHNSENRRMSGLLTTWQKKNNNKKLFYRKVTYMNFTMIQQAIHTIQV